MSIKGAFSGFFSIFGAGYKLLLLERVRMNIVSVTASVTSSAAGVASQSPVICHRCENRYAIGMIVTRPRKRVISCAYPPLLDAEK